MVTYRGFFSIIYIHFPYKRTLGNSFNDLEPQSKLKPCFLLPSSYVVEIFIYLISLRLFSSLFRLKYWHFVM